MYSTYILSFIFLFIMSNEKTLGDDFKSVRLTVSDEMTESVNRPFRSQRTNIFTHTPTLKRAVTKKLSSMKMKASPVRRGGSLTPYNLENIDSSEIIYEGCKPMRTWNLHRHGTRYTSRNVKKTMLERLPKIQELIISNKENESNCHSESFQNWTPNEEFVNKPEKILNKRGQDEMFEMGQRFRRRFKTLIPEKFNDKIRVRFTNTDRTKDSAVNFMTGLFDGEIPADKCYDKTKEKDKLLKYDSNCKRWKTTHQKSQFNATILKLYKEGKEVEKVRQNIENNCGLPKSSINTDDVFLIHMTCWFETSWGLSSPWCNVLSDYDSEVIEYLEDLDLHTNHGYGDMLSTQIPCLMFNDMMDHLLGKKGKDMVFYFTHLTAITKFIAHLKLFKDNKPLTLHNFEEMRNRKWRVSEFGTFATNLSFTLFECETGSQFILPLLQEKPVQLAQCPTAIDICPLDTFVNLFYDSIHKCKYDFWCFGISKKTESASEEEKELEEMSKQIVKSGRKSF